MLYRATIRPVTDTEALAPPDDVNAWKLHSFVQLGGDQLVAMWQFDDVLAQQFADRRMMLVDKYAQMQRGTDKTMRDLEYLLQRCDRDGAHGDVVRDLTGIADALRLVVREASQPYGPAC